MSHAKTKGAHGVGKEAKHGGKEAIVKGKEAKHQGIKAIVKGKNRQWRGLPATPHLAGRVTYKCRMCAGWTRSGVMKRPWRVR